MRHLRIYRAIRLIQRHGSIRKAAEHLAVSPSALNRSVQAFEEEMDVALFERIPGGVRLTSAGELLINVTERHLVEFEDLRQQFGDLRDGRSGVLRLSVGSDLGAGLVPEAIAQFEAACPTISVEIHEADDTTLLARRAVDLALLTNPATDAGVEVLASARVPLVAWFCAGPAGRKPPKGLWDLTQMRLILPPDPCGTRRALAHVWRRNRLEFGVTTSRPAGSLWPAMTRGPRAAIFPAAAAPSEGLPAGVVPLGIDTGSVEIAVLRTTSLPVPFPAQRFLKALQERLNTLGME